MEQVQRLGHTCGYQTWLGSHQEISDLIEVRDEQKCICQRDDEGKMLAPLFRIMRNH